MGASTATPTGATGVRRQTVGARSSTSFLRALDVQRPALVRSKTRGRNVDFQLDDDRNQLALPGYIVINARSVARSVPASARSPPSTSIEIASDSSEPNQQSTAAPSANENDGACSAVVASLRRSRQIARENPKLGSHVVEAQVIVDRCIVGLGVLMCIDRGQRSNAPVRAS